MRTYNIQLEETTNLKEITKAKAFIEFNKGTNIYIKLSKTLWFMYNIQLDDKLEDFNDGIQYFITEEFDDDKLIITRHKNIAQYYKSKGINARVVEFARPAEVYGKTLYGGTIPVHLMAFAKESYLLRIDTMPNTDFDTIPYESFESLNVEVKKYKVESEKVEF